MVLPWKLGIKKKDYINLAYKLSIYTQTYLVILGSDEEMNSGQVVTPEVIGGPFR